jgi:hypothetical protein
MKLWGSPARPWRGGGSAQHNAVLSFAAAVPALVVQAQDCVEDAVGSRARPVVGEVATAQHSTARSVAAAAPCASMYSSRW